MTPSESPCLRICIQDDALGFCIGCGRTVKEVLMWRHLQAAERERIRAGLPQRLTRVDPDDRRLRDRHEGPAK